MLSLFTLVLISIRFYDICVHKSAVAKYHNVSGFSVLPTMDSKARALLMDELRKVLGIAL